MLVSGKTVEKCASFCGGLGAAIYRTVCGQGVSCCAETGKLIRRRTVKNPVEKTVRKIVVGALLLVALLSLKIYSAAAKKSPSQAELDHFDWQRFLNRQ